MVRDSRGRSRLREALDGVRDLERLAGRAASGRATPRELGALRDSFQRLPDVAGGLTELAGSAFPTGNGARRWRTAADELDLLADLTVELEPVWPIAFLPHWARARSFVRATIRLSMSFEASGTGAANTSPSLQQRERERTGIPSLKVGFNKVFGYYLEVTHTHSARIPADYERRQTLATAERYVTPELKEYEAKVLGAEERIASREAELFGALRAAVGQAITRIQGTAQVVARLDVWAGLAERAVSNRYVRPQSSPIDLTWCSVSAGIR